MSDNVRITQRIDVHRIPSRAGVVFRQRHEQPIAANRGDLDIRTAHWRAQNGEVDFAGSKVESNEDCTPSSRVCRRSPTWYPGTPLATHPSDVNA